MKIELYDPPLCCSSGLCGPELDPELVRVNDALIALQNRGVVVERYNLSLQLQAVMENATVAAMIREKGKDVLPITFVNGELFRTGSYPALEELCAALGIEPQAPPQKLDIGMAG